MSNQKICTFYVSEFHLLTIILPYINEKIEEKQDILILSENDLISSVKKYLKQLTSFYQNEEVLELNWKKFNDNLTEKDLRKKEIFIIGEKDFIRKVNSKLEIKNVEQIIDCYRIKKLEEIDEVPKDYNYILNTSGICEVGKISQNVQKRRTIKSQL